MSTAAPEVQDALKEITEILERDGFTSSWTVDGPALHFAVGAGTADCADCLVPEPVLTIMLSTALAGTPYDVASVTLPRFDA